MREDRLKRASVNATLSPFESRKLFRGSSEPWKSSLIASPRIKKLEEGGLWFRVWRGLDAAIWGRRGGSSKQASVCRGKKFGAERTSGNCNCCVFFPILVNVLSISHEAVLSEKREGHDGRKGDSAEASHSA